jgi:DNA polymerase-3 subunit gamma/tau
MVFYRKYRPQKIDDLDSSSVREILHAILQKNIPHAFLFTGPKGLGKTSTARIVAKVVNCETSVKKRENGLEPCNTCDQCISITSGTNVDILEIDAASNRGIDEIRELKEKIRLSPVAAKRKVYIIDEVHMLTTEAFNALLKTLEEPPEHAMFILCTTEAHKVPETILSRCFNIQFKPATEEELVRSFKRIVKGEKVAIDEEALKVIASMADGGFRDGVKVLEESVLLAEGKTITKQLIENKYNFSTTGNFIDQLLKALKKRDVKTGLEIIQKMVDQGTDTKFFIEKLISTYHALMLIEIKANNQPAPSAYTLEEIKTIVELLSKAYGEMKTAVLPQLPLELAVIDWCANLQNQAGQNAEPRGNVIARNETDLAAGRQAKQSQDDRHPSLAMTNEEEVSVSSLRKQVGTIKKLKALYGEKKDESQNEEVIVTTTSVELMQTSGDGPVTTEWMDLFWRNLISEMKKYNHTVAGVLRGCTIKSYSDQNLIIQTAYKFHKERLDDMKTREALLKISKLLTGKDIQITVELRKSV